MFNDTLKDLMNQSRQKRHKLLFIVEKDIDHLDQLLKEFMMEGIPILNLNLLLSRALMEVPIDQRPFEVKEVLRSSLDQTNADTVCLQHIEYLFDLELRQDPVRLFESLSGNRLLIIFWPGETENGILRYARPEYFEFYQNREYTYFIYPSENL